MNWKFISVPLPWHIVLAPIERSTNTWYINGL